MDQRRGAHCGLLGMAFLLVLSLGATPRLSSVVPLPLSYPGGWATRCRVNLGAGENVPKRRAIVPPLPVEPPSVGVAGYILGENSVESVVEAYKNGSFVLLAEDGEEDARISLMINPEAVVGAEEIAFLEDAGTWGPRVALDASLDDKISGSMDKIVLDNNDCHVRSCPLPPA